MLENVESDVNYQAANVISFYFPIQIAILGDIHIGIRELWLIVIPDIHITKIVSFLIMGRT